MKSVLHPYFGKVRGDIIPGAHRLQKLVSKWIPDGILEIKSILVTGSNGKGSTCAYLERILREHNFKTGLYTSPHLVHPNERVRINGFPVAESFLEECLLQVEAQVQLFLPDATFFEIITATAFLIFLKEKIQFLICEVGLGGHFDSTNALSPLLSIITSISLEHTEFLGDSLKKIAADKSHIGRRNRPLVVAPLCEEAMEGIKETANKIGFNIVDVKELESNNINLCTALTAINELSFLQNINFNFEKIRIAIGNTFWPGRFDVRKINSRIVIFDASHNPDGFEFFSQQYFSSPFAKTKCVLLFASLNDKKWEKTLEKFHTIADYVYFTDFNSSRSVLKENYFEYIKQNKLNFPEYEVCAFEKAIEKSFKSYPELPLVITGSIAFIGSVFEHLNLEVFPK